MRVHVSDDSAEQEYLSLGTNSEKRSMDIFIEQERLLVVQQTLKK